MARVETPDKAPPLNNNINLFGLTDEPLHKQDLVE
jgi:hypothetical protein